MLIQQNEGAHFLPGLITRAIARIATLFDFDANCTLRPNHKAVLVELARVTETKSPTLPLKIRKKLISMRTGLSERTVYQCLLFLEECGWIERSEQDITRCGGAKVGEIQWTKKSLLRFFFEGSDENSKKLSTAKNTDACSISFGCSKEQQFVIQRHPEPVKREVQIRTKPESKVPENLRVLLKKIKPSGIFRLMSMCKQKPFNLEEVVKSNESNVLSSRNWFAYLCTLIQSEMDFSFLAKQKIQEQHVHSEKGRAEESFRDFCHKTGQRGFSLRIGKTVFQRDGEFFDCYQDEGGNLRRTGSLPERKVFQIYLDISQK